jgi:hypothetical protein
MSLHNLIANGGKVVVVGSLEKNVEGKFKFAEHPQIEFWSGEQKDIKQHVKNHGGRLPDNCRGLILSRFISHSETLPLMADARAKRALILPMKNDGEIAKLLEEIITPTIRVPAPQSSTPSSTPSQQEEAMEAAKPKKGELKQFVIQNDDPHVIPAQASIRLFKLAEQRGIKTTKASIEQCIRTYRHEIGVVGNGKSKARTNGNVKPTPQPSLSQVPDKQSDLTVLLKMINDSMATMALVKDEVAKIEKRNQEFAKVREMLARMGA